LEVADLEELAAGLGSDVPFFVRGVAAWCRGRGEIVEPLGEELPGGEVLLVKPPVPVPTAWAYGAWARGGFPATSGGRLGSIELMNDLEGPVFSKYLVLPVLKAWLLAQEGVAAAMMSGSGSTMIAFLNDGAVGLEERVGEEFGATFGMFRCRLGAVGGV
jgi:4-diphosphocytidyl-2-C-methyl-D-erythritol kinase